jgi:myosin heavy subunit
MGNAAQNTHMSRRVVVSQRLCASKTLQTEAAKRIMQYIAAVSGGDGGTGGIEGIKEMVLA